MSTYSEGPGQHPESGPPMGGGSYQEGPPPQTGQQYQGGSYQGGGGSYQGAGSRETSQFQSSGQQQHWEPNRGAFQGGGSMGSPARGLSVRSTFKTTEFWVYVLAVIAVLVAAALSDDDGGQGLGAHDAWWYVTLLTIGYMISRGLTKFSRYDHEDHTGHGHS